MAAASSRKKFLVTGSSGFIGTNLMTSLLRNGHCVVGLDRSSPRDPAHYRYWRKVDILDKKDVEEAFVSERPEIFIHLAARTDLVGGRREYLPNTVGIDNVLRALDRTSSLERAIFASSQLVCRLGYRPRNDTDYRPHTFYGESKVEGEIRVRRGGSRSCLWTIVRPTSVWGPWFGAPYLNFFKMVRRGFYYHPRGENILKHNGYVKNLIFQIEQLATSVPAAASGRTFYLADYEPTNVKMWADEIRSQFDAPPVREAPLWLLKSLAAAGDALQRSGVPNVPLTSFRLGNLRQSVLLELAELQQICGVLPYTMRGGVADTIAWMRERGE